MADESCSSPSSPMLRLLALVAATTAFTCPPGSILSDLGNPICYFANIKPMKYADARDYCLKQDASLAKLDSLLASRQIRSVAYLALDDEVDRKPNNETSMWIGAEIMLRWETDGDQVVYNEFDKDENCASSKVLEAKWTKIACDHALPFVCQQNAKPPTTIATPTTTIARPFTTAAPTTAVSTLSPNREPRYSCPNNLGDDKCASYEQYCNSALYRKTLTQSCAKTCGFCLDVCHDTLDYCPRMKPYCNSKDYEAYKTACPVTCGTCQGTTGNGANDKICRDTVKNCLAVRGRCTHPQYTYFTKVYCKKTCGFCR